MSVVEYRDRAYEADVTAMRVAGGSRVSIVSLIGDEYGGRGQIRNHSRAFRQRERGDWFLWCFFFDSLLDQAIYTVSQSTPATIDRPQSLQLGGILASYHVNLHPAMLLLAASLRCDYVLEAEANAEFTRLTASELRRYSIVLVDLAGRPSRESKRIYEEMSKGMALPLLPRDLGSFSKRKPNLRIYDMWTKAVAEAVNGRSR